jgi:hypothetical protein
MRTETTVMQKQVTRLQCSSKKTQDRHCTTERQLSQHEKSGMYEDDPKRLKLEGRDKSCEGVLTVLRIDCHLFAT